MEKGFQAFNSRYPFRKTVTPDQRYGSAIRISDTDQSDGGESKRKESKKELLDSVDWSEIGMLMTAKDQRVFGEIMLTLNDIFGGKYLEWGSGGSTRFAAKYVVGKNGEASLHSIEHQTKWCQQMMEDPFIQQAVNDMGRMYVIQPALLIVIVHYVFFCVIRIIGASTPSSLWDLGSVCQISKRAPTFQRWLHCTSERSRTSRTFQGSTWCWSTADSGCRVRCDS